MSELMRKPLTHCSNSGLVFVPSRLRHFFERAWPIRRALGVSYAGKRAPRMMKMEPRAVCCLRLRLGKRLGSLGAKTIKQYNPGRQNPEVTPYLWAETL